MSHLAAGLGRQRSQPLRSRWMRVGGFGQGVRCAFQKVVDRPLLADFVDLVAALFRTPPFSGSWSIFWGVVSGSVRASAPISLEPSCRHGASVWRRSKLCELPQILRRGRE